MSLKKTLQIGNGVALIATIFINYLSNTGLMNGTTIGEVSGGLRTLFTPSGYAFSIWAFIYLLLIAFIVYQGRSLFAKVRDDAFVMPIGYWFILSCIANSCWVVSWIYGYTGISCVLIFVLLFSLLKIVWNNRMELWDAPFPVIVFLWWPFVIYSGWVAVASIANVASYLVKINWDGFGIAPIIWTLLMIVVATILNLIVTWKRNMREFALVGAWALIAIGIANLAVEPIISYTSFIAAVILIISSGIHSHKGKDTSPYVKYLSYKREA